MCKYDKILINNFINSVDYPKNLYEFYQYNYYESKSTSKIYKEICDFTCFLQPHPFGQKPSLF